MFHLSALPEPIVQAPMAGGPSKPELVIAVCEAGWLGFLAAGYKPAPAVRQEIEAVRAATRAPFGVKLFVPSPEPADPESLREYLQELAPEAERQGAELGEPRFDDDDWSAELDLVFEQRIPVVSFTFGCPAADVVDRLHEANIAVWVTITNLAEATQAQKCRCRCADRLGHRGWRPSRQLCGRPRG
jgi:nitronate monooxygenase